jgi:short chain dehydrogenase
VTDLTGQVALVTGAGSGIGAAAACELAQAGAKVCCADLDELAAARVAETIIRSGGEATTLAVNVADVAENEAMVAAVVERFGALHIAHLNAGVHLTGSIFKTTPEQWDSVHVLRTQVCGSSDREVWRWIRHHHVIGRRTAGRCRRLGLHGERARPPRANEVRVGRAGTAGRSGERDMPWDHQHADAGAIARSG